MDEVSGNDNSQFKASMNDEAKIIISDEINCSLPVDQDQLATDDTGNPSVSTSEKQSSLHGINMAAVLDHSSTKESGNAPFEPEMQLAKEPSSVEYTPKRSSKNYKIPAHVTESSSLLPTRSRSSSGISIEIPATTIPPPYKPSAIYKSLSTHFKRVSIIEPVEGGNDALAGVSRPKLKLETSYGTIYPPMYRKLSMLHRLSFANIVERITLTWENVNVFAPAKKIKMFGKAKDGDVDLQPKHILKNGTLFLIKKFVFPKLLIYLYKHI